MKKLKVKDELCRELPMVMSDVNKDDLQSDVHVAEIKIAELQKQVRLGYSGFNYNFC